MPLCTVCPARTARAAPSMPTPLPHATTAACRQQSASSQRLEAHCTASEAASDRAAPLTRVVHAGQMSTVRHTRAYHPNWCRGARRQWPGARNGICHRVQTLFVHWSDFRFGIQQDRTRFGRRFQTSDESRIWRVVLARNAKTHFTQSAQSPGLRRANQRTLIVIDIVPSVSFQNCSFMAGCWNSQSEGLRVRTPACAARVLTMLLRRTGGPADWLAAPARHAGVPTSGDTEPTHGSPHTQSPHPIGRRRSGRPRWQRSAAACRCRS